MARTSNMLKAAMALVLCYPLAIAESEDDFWEYDVRVSEGYCVYRNKTFAAYVDYTLEEPCEKWNCYPDDQMVLEQHCPPPPGYEIPSNASKDAWPYCCSNSTSS
uniref:Uncharacterized protein n=1 Tax=Amblyomma maculatum TaxID=34609 RepID=G3MTA1_AMBMU